MATKFQIYKDNPLYLIAAALLAARQISVAIEKSPIGQAFQAVGSELNRIFPPNPVQPDRRSSRELRQQETIQQRRREITDLRQANQLLLDHLHKS